MTKRTAPTAMTIAGSDSGGGAGIQADLKTFAALGVYGASVITAVTAQNTLRVTGVHEIPTDFICAQIDAVLSDIGADAVKTGMLSSTAIIEAVADKLAARASGPLVVDPVMVAKSGDRLLREDAIDALRTRLLPMATVVTPNIPEAEALTGREIGSADGAKAAARDIVGMGAKAVVVKGGHLDGPPTDLLYDGVRFQEYAGARIETTSTHGTGCTFASAIAAGLAKGLSLEEAVGQAKAFVTEAMRRAFDVGQGHGPLHHFFALWDER